jgi:cell division protein FtsQ
MADLRNERPFHGGWIFSLFLGLGSLAAGGYLVWVLGQTPITSVRIAGEFRHVPPETLQEALANHLEKGFFQVDVEEICWSLRGIPWVKAARIHRIWPDRLHVRVEEREAVARWLERGIIEPDGSLFFPEPADLPADLPWLAGPEGRHQEVLRQYRIFGRLLAPLGQAIRALLLTDQGMWRIELANGLTIISGSQHLHARLAHFARVFEVALGAEVDAVLQVDLRYSNGFAVRWRDKPVAPESTTTAKAGTPGNG